MVESHLDRFVEAQSHGRAGFAAALDELRTGGKRGHWIWYIFPQLSGLGSSPASLRYEIDSVKEAADFLEHPVLSERLLEITTVVSERVKAGVRLERLMGSRIDTLKLVSSLTLFEEVARRLAASGARPRYAEFARVADEVLAAAEIQGHPRCRFTLAALAEATRRS
jgi:uncharacterized protein (DUF1810 family)